MNRIDINGLQEVVVFGEVDVVPIIGAEIAGGYVFNTNKPTESGHFLSGGTAGGLNVGAAVGVGYYARGAEGKSINYDFNFVVFSITLTYDNIGLHGGTITYGPGAGWSKSETNTKKTITLKDILSFFTNDDGCE
ncbi:MAG: hypothetical protein GXX85_01750 [Ignavibacteria bacterium]|nr:hypothetical protein [Ignavibacteria bacterium]